MENSRLEPIALHESLVIDQEPQTCAGDLRLGGTRSEGRLALAFLLSYAEHKRREVSCQDLDT